jgi:hypothetical protein
LFLSFSIRQYCPVLVLYGAQERQKYVFEKGTVCWYEIPFLSRCLSTVAHLKIPPNVARTPLLVTGNSISQQANI